MGELAAAAAPLPKSINQRLKEKLGYGGKKDAHTQKSGGGLSKLGRATSFNAGDTDFAASKAASEGYDPFYILRKTKPVVEGMICIQRSNLKVFSKWEDYWAELRGTYVLLFSEKPKESDFRRIDVANTVRALFQASTCAVSLEKRSNFVIKLTKNGESMVLKLGNVHEFESWAKELSHVARLKTATLSDFCIIAPIGRGAAGKVFLVRHRDTGRRMALKAIAKDESVFDSRSGYRHALDERMVLGMTEGSNLFVRLRHAFQTKNNIYLVTDFYDGGDLFFYLAANQCGMDEDRAKFILAEVLLAVQKLHSLSVVYRDLKPENILLDQEGHIRIADFGLCKVMDKGIAVGRTGTICGTHSYVAPEMVSEKNYGYSIDIFTIGVFLYHIMVGRPPFDANDMEDVKRNISRLNEIEYYDEFMSPEAIDFLKRILVPDPSSRFGCSESGFEEMMNHPFFVGISWDDIRERTGRHVGGLFTGGYELPPGMGKRNPQPEENDENKNPNDEPSNQQTSKSDAPWYEPEPSDNDHLLRNFDLKEWEGVSVDDHDDTDAYGDCNLWPLFKFHKKELDSNFIVGFNFASCADRI